MPREKPEEWELDPRLAEAESLSVGGEVHSTSLTLCIYGDDLDPQAVSAQLHCTPTRAARRGERDASHPRRPPAPIGRWFLEAPRELPLQAKVEYLLDHTTDDLATWRALAASCRIHLSVGIFLTSWNEGFTFPAGLIQRLAARHWPIGLDIYSADGEEIVESFLRRPH